MSGELANLRGVYRQHADDRLSELRAEADGHDWTGERTGCPVARPNQLPPAGNWRIWLLLAGRGFGKTRTGAEWVRGLAETGKAGRIALIGPTAADVRDVMIEGQSGLLAISPAAFRPRYEPSRRRLIWPNGAIATAYSADEPERLRGPQHDSAWADEAASWRYPAAWDMLMFGLRLGDDPRAVVTTTPKPVVLVRQLLAHPCCVTTRGSSYENRANLAPAFFEQITARYEGTRLGRQELYAEFLDDTPGALWTRAMIEECRRHRSPELARVVVAIDPAVTSGGGANETGIIVAGKDTAGRGYVLADLSCRLGPDGWARRAVGAFDDFQADRIVAEVNQGGDLVENVLRTVDSTIPFRALRASRGKAVRAEPIAALYEQKRISHVGGFAQLEDQMCAFAAGASTGGGGLSTSSLSPDRVDALVWAFTDLLLGNQTQAKVWRL